jgi:lysyl-tRNA synthetase, class II
MSRKERDTELSEEEFYMQRTATVKKLMEEGRDLYPHKFDVRHTMAEILKLASRAEDKAFDRTVVVRSAGRVRVARTHGKLTFLDAYSCGSKIQLLVSASEEKVGEEASLIRRGDIIGFSGFPGKSARNELSVYVTGLQILTPCLRTMPNEYYGLKDPELIYRRRYLDLHLNEESRSRFMKRCEVIQYIRRFLDERGFLEVETPMLNVIAGGAAARPFITHHNELNLDLFMRISPELYLKKLVIGGFDRVYELGKEYRNEGIDLTHNPEFTSCEFYMAYADYEDMMNLTEEMLSGIVLKMFNSDTIVYSPNKRGETAKPVMLSFRRPFNRINILERLSSETGLKLTGTNIESPETLKQLIEACNKEGIAVDAPRTLARVLDKLIGRFIEPHCVSPTFLLGYPVATSPLAKNHRSEPNMTERFELFINGKEICNAYTELNNPFEQRERFRMQAAEKSAGDEEAMMTDEDFCVALEYGLPPTGGWGIGIDRLVMYLTNAANIKDVILFPAMKPE